MVRTVKLGLAVVLFGGAIALYAFLAAAGPAGTTLPLPQPGVGEWTFVSRSETPPTQAQCFTASPQPSGRRCFGPQAIQSAYNVEPLYDRGLDGKGVTIAIVDSYGSDTIAHDLHVFDQAFGLQAMCGEEGVTCQTGMPTFSQLALQGTPATKAPPPTSQGTGLENKAAWATEVSLDVERAHAVAPGANILLVTTPTAETQGVQGFPQMIAAEDYVVRNHLAQVISQSFGSAEDRSGARSRS
jgi:subtilase family serine protease